MRNKLFTASVDKMLFKQYPLGDELEKQKVVAKIFNPYGDGRWYLLNSDPEDPDYIWAIVSMFGNVEIGSVSRSELLGARIRPFGLPLERDLYFTPQNAAEVYRGLLDGKFYKKGGVTDDLEKELRKLQRDLNSSRLSTYTEGDNSAEEMARQAERAAKLARFDEVLRLLRESDAKFAKGGISDSDKEKSIAELKRKIKHFREVEKSEPMARYYEEALFYMTEGKENDILKRGKYAKGGYMAKGGEMKNESKETDFYAITKWHTGEVKLVPIKNVSFWQGRQNDHEPTKENLELFFKQIPWDESVCIYDNDTASDGTLHSAHTPLFTAGAKYVHGIVDKNQNPVHFSYKGFFAKGGVTGYERLVKKVAANYEGKAVPSKYQSKYGKRYDADEAKKVGYAVATKVYGKPMARMAEGGETDSEITAEDRMIAQQHNYKLDL